MRMPYGSTELSTSRAHSRVAHSPAREAARQLPTSGSRAEREDRCGRRPSRSASAHARRQRARRRRARAPPRRSRPRSSRGRSSRGRAPRAPHPSSSGSLRRAVLEVHVVDEHERDGEHERAEEPEGGAIASPVYDAARDAEPEEQHGECALHHRLSTARIAQPLPLEVQPPHPELRGEGRLALRQIRLAVLVAIHVRHQSAHRRLGEGARDRDSDRCTPSARPRSARDGVPRESARTRTA